MKTKYSLVLLLALSVSSCNSQEKEKTSTEVNKTLYQNKATKLIRHYLSEDEQEGIVRFQPNIYPIECEKADMQAVIKNSEVVLSGKVTYVETTRTNQCFVGFDVVKMWKSNTEDANRKHIETVVYYPLNKFELGQKNINPSEYVKDKSNCYYKEGETYFFVGDYLTAGEPEEKFIKSDISISCRKPKLLSNSSNEISISNQLYK